jgi:hypothetical protein
VPFLRVNYFTFSFGLILINIAMSFYDVHEEERLANCLKVIAENPRAKKKALARQYRVSYDKLRRQIRHIADQRGKRGHNKRLNSTQDEGLKRYVSYLIRIGQPPNRQGRHSNNTQYTILPYAIWQCHMAVI